MTKYDYLLSLINKNTNI